MNRATRDLKPGDAGYELARAQAGRALCPQCGWLCWPVDLREVDYHCHHHGGLTFSVADEPRGET